MIAAEDEALAGQCGAVVAAAASGAEWIERNREQVRAEADVGIKDLRRAAYIARRLEAAARRRMCVGVFGPSQSGKSFLISALARPERGAERLFADFEGEAIDFIEAINPSGGRESTGIVTRFTMDRPSTPPAGKPVRLRLLGQTDIVKI